MATLQFNWMTSDESDAGNAWALGGVSRQD